jgi:hypothetical protein
MAQRIRNTRALFAAILTLVLVAGGFYAATAAYAQSGLTIVVDHVDANGWRAHIEGACPEGYELKTRNLEGRWSDNQSGATIRAHCTRLSDGFECWHVTKWVRNPGYVVPTRTPPTGNGPTATPAPPRPSPTPCPDCPVPTTTAPTATAEVPTATPTEVTAPPATAELPAPTPGTVDQPAAPVEAAICPHTADGMPVRWAHQDGRDVPICEERSGGRAPAPAATASGSSIVQGSSTIAHFDVVVTQGEVARAEYVFSDGTRQVVLDEPFSPDEERQPLPNPLQVEVPQGQTVSLELVVVGYDSMITVSSNAVSSIAVAAPEANAAASEANAPAPVARSASNTDSTTVIMPRMLPRTGGEIDEHEAFWLGYGKLIATGAVVLITLGLGLRMSRIRHSA